MGGADVTERSCNDGMYVIEHALLNLWKNKGRNILLGVIIFAIITATVVALAIYNTAGVVIEETRAALQCAVRVAPLRRTAGSGGEITVGGEGRTAGISLEQYLSFAESEFLDGADIKENTRSIDGVEAVFYLKRPEMLPAFETELRNKGLPDAYTVRTDESAFENIADPVESLQNLSFTFLIIILVLGAAIMMLLSLIAIRERKYEIGVLRAMGMKKKRIAVGLCIEVLVITCVCFALGIGAGAALSQHVSDAIMTGQAQSSDTGSTTLADRLNGPDTELPRMIDISLSAVTVFQILGVSLLLATITGVISVSRITKSEPIKILMERV